jgi:hypothetical protein
MAAFSRRAEGRRPPHRGRSDCVKAQVSGATRDQETVALGEGPSHRESRELLRQRGRLHVRSCDSQTRS